MKNILFLLFPLFAVCHTYGQSDVKSFSVFEYGEYDGVKYEIEKIDVPGTNTITRYRNVLNEKMEIEGFVNLDGTPATGTWADYHIDRIDGRTLVQIIDEAFTREEIAALVQAKANMWVSFIFDNTGKTLEVEFSIGGAIPLYYVPLSRIAYMERQIKARFSATITDPATKNLQFIYDVTIYVFGKDYSKTLGK